MCGIAGVIGPGARVFEPQVRAMIASLRHRGPDDSGVTVFDHAVLGTARLAIIDPGHGHQPLLSPGEDVAVVCNGEIYGHRRIRERFPTYPFRTGSDVEVLLPMYARDGAGLLGGLPGTFAFAIWDEPNRELLLARDRFGERPLYWAMIGEGRLAFASEVTALVSSGLVDGRPDPSALSHMLRQGYVPPGQCVWSGVSSLPPASRLRWTPDRPRPVVERWWEPPPPGTDPGSTQAVDWLSNELDRAVGDQLEADVSVGTFLSGGIDSSTITALAARRHPGIKAFAFDMPGGSEIEFAREVAALHDVELHEIRPDESCVADQLVSVAAHWDEPFGDSSALPTWLLARAAREHVTVALTGDGADELLGGYLTWTRTMLEEGDPARGSGSPTASPTRTAVLTRAARRVVASRRRPNGGDRHAIMSGVAERYSRFRTYFDDDELMSLGLPPVGVTHIEPGRYLDSSVEVISRFDLDHYLPGDILVKTDRASMASGLEVRSPFLDVAVAEGCLALPSSYKVDPTAEKVLLRRCFASILPESVVNRPKQGFGAPMDRWLSLPAVVDLVNDLVGRPGAAVHELIELDQLGRFLHGGQQTWNLLSLALWWEGHRRLRATP